VAAVARDAEKVPGVTPARLSWEDIQSKAEASARTSEVFVQEWEGTVLVRGLFLDEARDVWTRSSEGRSDTDPAVVACYTVAYGCLEPRIPVEQAMILGKQSAGVIFKLFQIIDKLTGVSEAEVRRAAEAFRDS